MKMLRSLALSLCCALGLLFAAAASANDLSNSFNPTLPNLTQADGSWLLLASNGRRGGGGHARGGHRGGGGHARGGHRGGGGHARGGGRHGGGHARGGRHDGSGARHGGRHRAAHRVDRGRHVSSRRHHRGRRSSSRHGYYYSPYYYGYWPFLYSGIGGGGNGFYWRIGTYGNLPYGATIGGYDNYGRPYYYCRAYYHKAYYRGRLYRNGCSFRYHGRAIVTPHYRILAH